MTVVAIAFGTVIRLWFLFHVPSNADEATVGLMAQQILRLHSYVFYWGQDYGGGEFYLTAILFGLFGQSVLVLKSTAVVLFALTALLTWRVALRMVGNRSLAALSGALSWAVSIASIQNSTTEYGFRGLTLACSLGLLLQAVRIGDGKTTYFDWWLFGLIGGVGWWSSPEIAYFAVPSIFLVSLHLYKTLSRTNLVGSLSRLLLALLGAVVGALPWIWANLHSDWASIRYHSYANNNLSSTAPGYLGHLKIFFEYTLPIQLGWRETGKGTWVAWLARDHAWEEFTVVFLMIILVVAIFASLWLAIRRSSKSFALLLGIAAFPFIYGLSPAVWFWSDGRYAVFLPPLIALLITVGADAFFNSRTATALNVSSRVRQKSIYQLFSFSDLAASVPSLAWILLTLATFLEMRPASMTTSQFILDNWTQPDSASITTADTLERHRIRFAYADYWVAYKLDFLSHNRLHIATIGSDPSRWRALQSKVIHSARPAWLFVSPNRFTQALHQFGQTSMIVGPDGMTEARFTQSLHKIGVPYRTFQAGLLDVVMPSRTVSASQIGLPTASGTASGG